MNFKAFGFRLDAAQLDRRGRENTILASIVFG
jgi:hypothetical protein